MITDPHKYPADENDGYDEIPKPCIACDLETLLRCARCRQPVCHNCENCPNGCDATTVIASP